MTDVPTTALTNADIAPTPASVTTGATMTNVDQNIRAYNITTGGTAGDEILNVPNFAGANANFAMGQRIVLLLQNQTDPSDVVRVYRNGSGTIPFYSTAADPTLIGVKGGIVLNYEGAMAVLIWTGSQWNYDQNITSGNDGTSDFSFTTASLQGHIAEGTSGAAQAIVYGGDGNGAAQPNGADVRIKAGDGDADNGGVPGNIFMVGMPTADPHIAHALWNNGGVLTVSAG